MGSNGFWVGWAPSCWWSWHLRLVPFLFSTFLTSSKFPTRPSIHPHIVTPPVSRLGFLLTLFVQGRFVCRSTILQSSELDFVLHPMAIDAQRGVKSGVADVMLSS